MCHIFKSWNKTRYTVIQRDIEIKLHFFQTLLSKKKVFSYNDYNYKVVVLQNYIPEIKQINVIVYHCIEILRQNLFYNNILLPLSG